MFVRALEQLQGSQLLGDSVSFPDESGLCKTQELLFATQSLFLSSCLLARVYRA